MLNQTIISYLAADISQKIDTDFKLEKINPVGGGCINQSYKVSGGEKSFFVKLNQATQIEMFIAEALGLEEIAETKTIRVPQVICYGTVEQYSYLVMEWLDFGTGNKIAWQKMGQQLAKMHRVGKASAFGWHRNNTIGSTPQINDWRENWADFFAELRIGYQLRLANRRGGNFPDYETVIEVIKEHLSERNPQPSLVHGDLWSGNVAITVEGEPVIIDPAVYYGDREVDIAMTELFGGFPAAFYQGYNQIWELDFGYSQRKKIYNLYHVLNHFNLFGGGYGGQANRLIAQILR
ncbi:MAG: fructosamine kinase family protein [Cyanobacteria bacterium J149]|nr:MAG: fructosamine kinase family protein [Cyanobacteria bacterium J149]